MRNVYVYCENLRHRVSAWLKQPLRVFARLANASCDKNLSFLNNTLSFQRFQTTHAFPRGYWSDVICDHARYKRRLERISFFWIFLKNAWWNVEKFIQKRIRADIHFKSSRQEANRDRSPTNFARGLTYAWFTSLGFLQRAYKYVIVWLSAHTRSLIDRFNGGF